MKYVTTMVCERP
jgi:predicted transposase YdaD